LLENNIPIIEKEKIIKDRDNIIGEGSFGKVYRGMYGDIMVAIKKLKLHQLANVEEIMHEIKAVSRLSHPRIPKFFGVWKTDKYLQLIFDFINGITLKEWFQTHNPSNKLKLDIIIQLVEVIEVMHSQNIIHRDLKPENILIMDQQVYVIDFGVSKISTHTQTGTNKQKGTVAYFGPENCQINTDKDVQNIITISPKYDIWSIGCITSYIFSNRYPWSVKVKPKKSKDSKGKEKENSKENSKECSKESSKELKNKNNSNDTKSNKEDDKDKDKKYENLKDYNIIGNLTLKVSFPIPKCLPQELIDILELCFLYNPNDRISATNLKLKLKDYYDRLE